MNNHFSLNDVLHDLQHYLPSQAPLKDFIHHNTLHAFEKQHFFDALQNATEIFGHKTLHSMAEYQELFALGKISKNAILHTLETEGKNFEIDFDTLVATKDDDLYSPRIGNLRKYWKIGLYIDLNSLVHFKLFKLVSNFLDQGINANHPFNQSITFIDAVFELNKNSFAKIFKSNRVDSIIQKGNLEIVDLLQILVGKADYFKQYLFDQQFSHPGWSGMVSLIQNQPSTLFDTRKISLEELIIVELLLEIDALDNKYGIHNWNPICSFTKEDPIDVFDENISRSKIWACKKIWQLSFEKTYYDQVVFGITSELKNQSSEQKQASFQAFFCIDDREESIRRHIEVLDSNCETFGTAAHFNLPIYYRPAGGKFNTQVCPAPISPKHIILDESGSEKSKKDLHFHQSSKGLLSGWLITQTIGFWSALKLFLNVFKPTVSPSHSSSLEHMHHKSQLHYFNESGEQIDGLQIGFTLEEMRILVGTELRKTGLLTNFAPLIYIIGHGGSSTNNPYYAGYNCGACSGRPSSLNARLFAKMANREDVRKQLKEEGINIPDSTCFIGGMHDTTRDEFSFYDTDSLKLQHSSEHENNLKTFNLALTNNAKERARQFASINLKSSKAVIHQKIRRRSVALFEPRPELNHSNNCLCIVGKRSITKNLFLDQRAFLHSYNWETDKNGTLLTPILNAVTPVCGGINLEYYFSRTDNENFGAGSKLPHNVVGLFGVVNGIEGDLRTGLPSQMIEVHDPLRLLMIVEQKPEVVLNVLKANPITYSWYQKEWINLIVIDPETSESYQFSGDQFVPSSPLITELNTIKNMEEVFETQSGNLPVYKLN